MSRKTRSYSDLAEALEARGADTRAAAALALEVYGAGAVEPLCRALEDEDLGVRTAAARSLGRIGDARAVEPLCAALKRCMGGRSARAYLFSGIILFGIEFALSVLVTCLSVVFIGGGVLTGLGILSERRKRSQLAGAITEALARIAEADPRPELRQLLPELRAIAADALQQEQSTRRVSREAARRVGNVTERLKDLPRPASAPAPDLAVLPRPAGSPAPDARTLPRER